MSRPRKAPGKTTLDPAEQARFAGLGSHWWGEDSELEGLKAYNPVRIGFLKDAVQEGLGHKGTEKLPFAGLRMLDIGCGGGILAEELARLGAQVTGIDATPEAIAAAKAHAARSRLDIAYQVSTIERFKHKTVFDVVIASEVLEHVADPELFLQQAAKQVRKGGILLVTTFNRTLRSLAFGIIAAEHLLRVAPIGTHSWKKFLRPSEVAALLEENGLQVQEVKGALYNPITGKMRPSRTDLAVNYMLWARKIHIGS